MYLYDVKVSLTQEELVFLDKKADETGKTVSEIIEDLVKEKMSEHTN